MRIVMVSASRVPSDTANSLQVMKAAQATAQAGHQVMLSLAGNERTPFPDLAQRYGLQTRFDIEWLPVEKSRRGYDLAWNAVRRAARRGAELVYTWMPQAAVLALWHGLPAVLEMHDLPGGRFGPTIFRLFWRAGGRKRMVCITRALLQRLVDTFHLSPGEGETLVCPNGVDLERYSGLPDPGSARAILGLPQAFTAAYTGHFYPGRGLDLLCTLARENPGIQFLWIGGRPDAVESWRSRLSGQGIRNVTLTGFIPNQDLPRWQAAADVLLMPYEQKIAGSSGGDSAAVASPMKMFEYMACGRPILTSDLPVIREVLNPGNALFCPPAGEAAWQAALLRLQSDEALRQQLGNQASRDVQQYTWLRRQQKILAEF